MILFNSLERRILRAKINPDEMNRLITEYQPFIAKTVREHIGRYVERENSDEFAVALTAFHEAIKAYDSQKGKFLSFAARVIRLRLIDHYRNQHRKKPEYSLEASQESEGHDITAPAALKDFQAQKDTQQRRYEILSLTEDLSQWGITFSQLADHSPKQDNLRFLYKEVAHTIVQTEALFNRLMATKRLPINEILDICAIDRKRLDRGRIYIIACVIILKGDYQFIQDYMEWK